MEFEVYWICFDVLFVTAEPHISKMKKKIKPKKTPERKKSQQTRKKESMAILPAFSRGNNFVNLHGIFESKWDYHSHPLICRAL